MQAVNCVRPEVVYLTTKTIQKRCTQIAACKLKDQSGSSKFSFFSAMLRIKTLNGKLSASIYRTGGTGVSAYEVSYPLIWGSPCLIAT